MGAGHNPACLQPAAPAERQLSFRQRFSATSGQYKPQGSKVPSMSGESRPRIPPVPWMSELAANMPKITPDIRSRPVEETISTIITMYNHEEKAPGRDFGTGRAGGEGKRKKQHRPTDTRYLDPGVRRSAGR